MLQHYAIKSPWSLIRVCERNPPDVSLLICWCCGFFCSLDALVLRFEAPDSRNRWDSPLFTIQQEDTPPFDGISDAIFKRKAPPPNQSTLSVSHTDPLEMYVQSDLHLFGIFIQQQAQQKYKVCLLFLQQPLSSTNFLYELDKVTQEVLMVSPSAN